MDIPAYILGAEKGRFRVDSVEKVSSLKSLQICRNSNDNLRLTLIAAADRFRTVSVESEVDDEVPHVRV